MLRYRSLVAALLVGACVPAGQSHAARIAELNRIGVRVHPDAAGWYRLSADGYRFSMPSLPMAASEDFYFGATHVPQRFFDLDIDHSRLFLVRVFDARALDDGSREELRVQALELFMPSGTSLRGRETVVEGGVRIEQMVVDGYGEIGVGMLRSFVKDGFVFQMLAVVEPGWGAPTDVDRFLRSALQ